MRETDRQETETEDRRRDREEYFIDHHQKLRD